jgi:hypothetical protein
MHGTCLVYALKLVQQQALVLFAPYVVLWRFSDLNHHAPLKCYL